MGSNRFEWITDLAVDDGQKHGLWKRSHSSGLLWDEGRFERGKKKGTWMVYDDAGELVKKRTSKWKRRE